MFCTANILNFSYLQNFSPSSRPLRCRLYDQKPPVAGVEIALWRGEMTFSAGEFFCKKMQYFYSAGVVFLDFRQEFSVAHRPEN